MLNVESKLNKKKLSNAIKSGSREVLISNFGSEKENHINLKCDDIINMYKYSKKHTYGSYFVINFNKIAFLSETPYFM